MVPAAMAHRYTNMGSSIEVSITAMVWALKKAPVSEPVEALILVGLADHAGDDGTDAYPSQALLAKYGRCSPSTVKRRLSSLEDAGLIHRGDQQKVAHLPVNRRPIVWDLNLRLVTRAGKHAEDFIEHPEEILGGQADPPVTTDPPNGGVIADSPVTTDTPNLGGSDGLGGHREHLGGSHRTLWGVTDDLQTVLEPSLNRPLGGKPAKPTTAHAIPDDFGVSEDRSAWAKEHAPAVNAKRETEAFVDYWDGEGGKKKNWETTWRNWMRRAQTDAERRGWKPQGASLTHPNYGWIEGNR